MSETTTGRFSADDQRALAILLDEIIPPGGARNLPGAGELGIASFVAEFARTMPVLQPVIEQGLATLARLAASRRPSRCRCLRIGRLGLLHDREPERYAIEVSGENLRHAPRDDETPGRRGIAGSSRHRIMRGPNRMRTGSE